MKSPTPLTRRAWPNALQQYCLCKPGLLLFAAFVTFGGFAVQAALQSGVYYTLPGTIVEERGDRVPGGVRPVPLSVTLSLDMTSSQPSLTAFLDDAVLEGGDPFALSVHSSSAFALADGSYRFRGEYIEGTQYGFDWTLAPLSDGSILWNGGIGWYGGHSWQVTISDVLLVPEPAMLPWLVMVGTLCWSLRCRSSPK